MDKFTAAVSFCPCHQTRRGSAGPCQLLEPTLTRTIAPVQPNWMTLYQAYQRLSCMREGIEVFITTLGIQWQPEHHQS
jgi:hypothetical protein